MSLSTTQKVALAIGTPLTVAAIGWGGLNAVAAVGRGSEPVSQPVSVRDGTISAHMSNGDVTVTSSAAGRASLTGTVHYSLFRPAITTSPDGTLGIDCALPVGSCGLDATLSVPAGLTSANLTTDLGDVTLNGSSLPGTLNIATGTGDIRASGLTSSDVTLHSSLGDVTVVFLRPPDKLTVSDATGDIRIVLPPGSTKYRVSAHSSLGDVSAGSIPQDPNSMHEIDLTTSLGDITITEASS